MLHEFYLKRFRYESLAATSECLTVTINKENETLTIRIRDKADPFIGLNVKLGFVRILSISLGRGPYSAMVRYARGSGHEPLFLEFQHASDRSSFHAVLKRETLNESRFESSHGEQFSRWEDNVSELSMDEVHTILAAKDAEIKSLSEKLASACVDQPTDTGTEPQRRCQLEDLYPFKISHVSRVVDAYRRNKEDWMEVHCDFANALDKIRDAKIDIAHQQARIADLVVALMNPDAIPAILCEEDLHRYLMSSSINLKRGDISALEDNPNYKQAVARVFRQQRS